MSRLLDDARLKCDSMARRAKEIDSVKLSLYLQHVFFEYVMSLGYFVSMFVARALLHRGDEVFFRADYNEKQLFPVKPDQ